METNCAPLLADIHVFLYSYEAEFIQSLLSTGRKQLASLLNFTYRYIDDVLSINNPEFENYLHQMYTVELEIKDMIETPLLLLTWIYFCQSGGTINFILPFMTNMTLSISISQIFRSWVAIYHIWPPMASLSHGLNDMPGLAPECFILRQLSNQLLEQGYGIRQGTLEIVIEEVFWSIRRSYPIIWSSSLTNA